jgi:tight adherence protein C
MSITEYLPLGMTPDDAFVIMAAIAAVLTVLAVWHGLLVRDPLGARIKGLAKRREQLRSEMMVARPHQQRLRGIGFMDKVVKRFKLLRQHRAKSISDKLARAGWRSRDGVVIYLFFKLSLPVAFALVSAVLFYGLELYNLPSWARLVAVLASVVVGLYGPDVFVKNQTDKRRHKLRMGLPDALDLMVICTEAGLSLDASLKRVSREMARSLPEIAEEFGLTSVELGFLPERTMALKNLVRRTNLASIRGVVNTLAQTERYGTPLAQSLRVLAAEFRDQRLMKAEEKAARLPATLTVPMIFFILPPLFIVLLGPGIMRFIDALTGAPLPL